MKIDSEFHIPCPECGGIEFEHPIPLEDSSFVKCDSCGFEAMLSDFREHGLEKASEHAKRQIKSQLKKEFRKYFK